MHRHDENGDPIVRTSPTDHALGHVTGGGDVIADAVPGGDSGLMSGSDKTKLDLLDTLLETVDLIPVPEGRSTTDATRVCQTTLEGASFLLTRTVDFGRVVLRATALQMPGAFIFGIYQAADGGSGVASLVASCSSTPLVTGTLTLTPSEALPCRLVTGLCYVLFGRSSATGSVTLRTYTLHPLDLLTANVPFGTHPTSFTTAFLASLGLPATFDPRVVPTGQATESALNIAPIFRLKAA